jgi:methyl-accepting chemotaxis protein
MEASKVVNLKQESSPNEDILNSIKNSYAYIEFTKQGKVLSANEAFLSALGYSLDEIVGKHHKMFVDPNEASSMEYRRFWDALGAGEAQTREFKRKTKNGSTLWIYASYIPVKNAQGEVEKVIKLAQDINSRKLETAEHESKLGAISKSMAVIEFKMDGSILNANDNFLKTLGYEARELQGAHHRMFCDPAYTSSPAYKAFWDKLNRGEFDSGEYKRITKSGKEIWIQASYNPVFDLDGKPFKVIKFAEDITEKKRAAVVNMRFASMTESSPSNLMAANMDFEITYLNPRSVETLKKIEKLLPVPVEKVLGSKIDIFHKDPSHQRKLLSNERNLPIKSFIKVGGETLELLVAATYDDKKNYTGPMVAWEVVTQKLKNEQEMAKISSMMENAPVNVMYCNLDFEITYLNPKSKATLRTLERHLPISVDKIDGAKIDVFHKNPDHQRKLLSSERNLPISSKIRVADQTLSLLVSATYDQNKNYLGPMVVWEVITDKLNLINSLEETANSLAGAANELTATATQMSGNANKMSQESTSASASAEEVATGVQTVATNTEEMAASIKEIARSANESAEMSKSTLTRAQDTNKTITSLGVSSQEIGNVIKVISSIAQQTNLLALNATIEAARAGDAGKGFAVVANEVKELAKQTAKATEEITNKIGAIQKDSQGAVEAIGGISTAVEKLNSIAGAIAAAVEEQTATTNEVSRVVQESSKGVEGISQTIKVVSAGAAENSAASNQTLDAAKGLSQLAEKLKNLVKSVQV